jgi:dCTP deaminase
LLFNGDAIAREHSEGRIVIDPFDRSRVRAASYVLSLGPRFRRWLPSNQPIEIWSADAASEHLDDPVEADSFTLQPGEFLLGSTLEVIGIPDDIAGTISPLSHIARFGLGVHGGANFVNPGFGSRVATRLALEISNNNPSAVTLRAGIPFIHLRLERIEATPASTKPQSIYEGADPLVPPKLFEEWSSR